MGYNVELVPRVGVERRGSETEYDCRMAGWTVGRMERWKVGPTYEKKNREQGSVQSQSTGQ